MVRRIPLLLPVALLLASCDDHPAPTKAQPTPAQQVPVPDEIEEPPPPPPPTEQPEDVVEEVLIVESEAAPEAK